MKREIIKKIFRRRETHLLVVIVFIVTILSLLTDKYLSYYNIEALSSYIGLNMIMMIGMTNLFISGGFDIGIGSVFAFTGVFAGILIRDFNVPISIVIIITVLIGTSIGAITGFCVSKLRVNPFIATLASLFIYRALTLVISKANSIKLPESFTNFGQIQIYRINIVTIIGFILTIIAIIFLRKNKYFRQNYYLGINEKAASLVGIKVVKLKILNYSLVSGLAAVASLLNISRLKVADFRNGENTAIILIAGVIIGGASLSGGKGTIYGSFLGLILVTILNHSLSVLGIAVHWNKFLLGILLTMAVIIDVRINRK